MKENVKIKPFGHCCHRWKFAVPVTSQLLITAYQGLSFDLLSGFMLTKNNVDFASILNLKNVTLVHPRDINYFQMWLEACLLTFLKVKIGLIVH